MSKIGNALLFPVKAPYLMTKSTLNAGSNIFGGSKGKIRIADMLIPGYGIFRKNSNPLSVLFGLGTMAAAGVGIYALVKHLTESNQPEQSSYYGGNNYSTENIDYGNKGTTSTSEQSEDAPDTQPNGLGCPKQDEAPADNNGLGSLNLKLGDTLPSDAQTEFLINQTNETTETANETATETSTEQGETAAVATTSEPKASEVEPKTPKAEEKTPEAIQTEVPEATQTEVQPKTEEKPQLGNFTPLLQNTSSSASGNMYLQLAQASPEAPVVKAETKPDKVSKAGTSATQSAPAQNSSDDVKLGVLTQAGGLYGTTKEHDFSAVTQDNINKLYDMAKSDSACQNATKDVDTETCSDGTTIKHGQGYFDYTPGTSSKYAGSNVSITTKTENTTDVKGAPTVIGDNKVAVSLKSGNLLKSFSSSSHQNGRMTEFNIGDEKVSYDNGKTWTVLDGGEAGSSQFGF